MLWVRVIAIDPGVTTGYTYGEIQNSILKYHVFQEKDEVWDFWTRLRHFNPQYIVMEDFEWRRGVQGLNMFPMQLIGIARLHQCCANDCSRLFLQKASTGKSHFKDDKMKFVGAYKRGVPHGTDSARHLMHWCKFGFGFQFFKEGIVTIEDVGLEYFNV